MYYQTPSCEASLFCLPSQEILMESLQLTKEQAEELTKKVETEKKHESVYF